jgi:hypothetical protein
MWQEGIYRQFWIVCGLRADDVKIPADATIAPEKLVNYLLVLKPKTDKSKFLAQAGFTLDNPAALEAAIRALIAENDAEEDRIDQYGVYYRVTGVLRGVSGNLSVVTVWILGHEDGSYRFITMKPD